MLTNIAVLVSGGGTNLQALIDAQEAGTLHSGRIILVISSRSEAYALKRAAAHGIPTLVIPRASFGTRDAFEYVLHDALQAHHIDLIVLAGFLHILSNRFVSRYPNRIINVHPSLIPSFCGGGYYGLKVHQAVLSHGVKVTGATVHYVNEVPDGGEILMQKAVDVLPGDTPETLQRRVMEQAEWVLLPQAVEMASANILKSKVHET